MVFFEKVNRRKGTDIIVENLISYVNDTAFISMEENPPGEVDFLIFAQISYWKLEDLVPGMLSKNRGVTIGSLAGHPGRWRMFRELWFAKEHILLLEALSESRRFREIRMFHYSNVYDKRRDTQFAAVCFSWAKDKTCIAFRGTDESLAGWKEDFCMAFSSVIPSQTLAKTYFRQVALKCGGELFVTGHSKGGNLAYYSVLFASETERKKVKCVYNFDGPGFPYPLLQEGQGAVLFKKLIPRQSIIGMLYERGRNYQVIESEGKGLMQHNPFLWKVCEGKFVRAKKQTPEYRKRIGWVMNKTQHSSGEKQRELLNRMFEIIEYTGESSLWQIWKHRKRSFQMLRYGWKELSDAEKSRKKQN